MTNFFHVSNNDMKPSTILIPNYGKTILDPRYFRFNDYNYSQYLKEVLFDEIRAEFFPEKPSRLNSIYLVGNFQSAKEYKDKFSKKYIYEVTIQSSGPALRADMTWMDRCNRQSVSDVRKIIKHYFSGLETDRPFFEYLFSGKVVIKERIQI